MVEFNDERNRYNNETMNASQRNQFISAVPVPLSLVTLLIGGGEVL